MRRGQLTLNSQIEIFQLPFELFTADLLS